MRKWILTCAVIFSVGLQAQDFQSQIYTAYLKGRMDTWKGIMQSMDRKFKQTKDMDLLYQLAEVEYGYIAYSISVDKKEEAKRILIQAEEHIEVLLDYNERNPRVHALQGALYGYRLTLRPIKAPVYGKKSASANERALQLGPSEPQAWMEKANIEYYKPAIFGGSKKDAIPLYEKAIALYEASPDRTRQNWVYLNCLAGLGLAYEENGQVEQAGMIFRKLLELEPDFSWIRDEIYPDYLQKHSLD
jgi:tetratricopeptide (TPR) repeat protein